MPDATTSTSQPIVAPQIQLQIEIVGPIILIVVGLIGLIYRNLSQRIEKAEKRMDTLEIRHEEALKEVGDKIDKVLEKISDLALQQANNRTSVFERFVTKEECSHCKGKE